MYRVKKIISLLVIANFILSGTTYAERYYILRVPMGQEELQERFKGIAKHRGTDIKGERKTALKNARYNAIPTGVLKDKAELIRFLTNSFMIKRGKKVINRGSHLNLLPEIVKNKIKGIPKSIRSKQTLEEDMEKHWDFLVAMFSSSEILQNNLINLINKCDIVTVALDTEGLEKFVMSERQYEVAWWEGNKLCILEGPEGLQLPDFLNKQDGQDGQGKGKRLSALIYNELIEKLLRKKLKNPEITDMFGNLFELFLLSRSAAESRIRTDLNKAESSLDIALVEWVKNVLILAEKTHEAELTTVEIKPTPVTEPMPVKETGRKLSALDNLIAELKTEQIIVSNVQEKFLRIIAFEPNISDEKMKERLSTKFRNEEIKLSLDSMIGDKVIAGITREIRNRYIELSNGVIKEIIEFKMFGEELRRIEQSTGKNHPDSKGIRQLKNRLRVFKDKTDKKFNAEEKGRMRLILYTLESVVNDRRLYEYLNKMLYDPESIIKIAEKGKGPFMEFIKLTEACIVFLEKEHNLQTLLLTYLTSNKIQEEHDTQINNILMWANNVEPEANEDNAFLSQKMSTKVHYENI